MKTSFEIRSKITELNGQYRSLFENVTADNATETEASADKLMAEIEALEKRAKSFEKIEASEAEFETRAKAKRPTVEMTVSAGSDDDAELEAYRAHLRGETRAAMTAAGNPNTIPTAVQPDVKIALSNDGNVLPNLNIIYSNDGSNLNIGYTDDLTNLGSYLGETDSALTGNSVGIAMKTLGAWDVVSGEIGISDKLIRDSGIDIVSHVNKTVFKRLARKLEKEVLVGDGLSGHAEGVFTAANVAVTTTASNTSVSAADLFALQTAVSAYEPNAKWYLHSTTLNSIRGLNDTTGRPLLAEGLNSATPTVLCGKPVVISDFIPPIAANTVCIGYGDLAETTSTRIVGSSMTMDVFTDSKYKAVLQTGFQGHVSFDSKVTNGSAFKLLKTKA
jgi:HK97 family phage major capsid protein